MVYALPLLRFYTVASQDGLKAFWRQIDELANIFQIQISNASALSNPSIYTNVVSEPFYGQYLNLLAHKDTYTRLVHNGILYFIDQQDKVGFSILNNKEVAAEYGLVEFLSKLRPASISYSSMIEQGYIINAL